MSFTPAKTVTSSQPGVHKNLGKVVTKHLLHQSRKPILAHNQAQFDKAYQWWQAKGQGKVILDSACGTGESSRWLAENYPDAMVIGLDQSAKRLSHSDNTQLSDNCLLLRCECTDFWRLAKRAQWQFGKHTLFYPNPWPKPQHLQRRWHGNPSFIALLAISQSIELRTNWHIYAEEFYQALLVAQSLQQDPAQDLVCTIPTLPSPILNEYRPSFTITAFERKYHISGHKLWQVSC